MRDTKWLFGGLGLGLGLALGGALFGQLPGADAASPEALEKKLQKRLVKLLKQASKKGSVAGGVATGLVTDNVDPDELGRIQVRFPWQPAGEAGLWVHPLTHTGADGFLPELDDEVLVGFAHGDIRQPYLIGVRPSPPRRPER